MGFTEVLDERKISADDTVSIARDILAFERSMRAANVEHSLVISPLHKKLFHLVGNEVAVDPSIIGERYLKDSICVHNHPFPELGPSREDFYFSVNNDVLVNRVVDRKNRFVLKASPNTALKNPYEIYKWAKELALEELYKAWQAGIDLNHDENDLIMSKIPIVDSSFSYASTLGKGKLKRFDFASSNKCVQYAMVASS